MRGRRLTPPATSPPRPTINHAQSERTAKPPAIPITSPVTPPKMVKTRAAFLRSAVFNDAAVGWM